MVTFPAPLPSDYREFTGFVGLVGDDGILVRDFGQLILYPPDEIQRRLACP